jgi:Flp pilus assembly protein TadB
MIAAVLLGALTGAALFGVLLRVAPPRPAPVVELALLDIRHARDGQSSLPDRVADERAADPAGWAEVSWRAGGWLAGRLRRLGIAQTALKQDLAITGGTFQAVLGRKLLLAVAGLLAGVGLTVLVGWAAGVGVPAGAPLASGAAGAAAGFFAPDLRVRRLAQRRRAEFRCALGGYLDLVSLEMAGSAAPAEALPSAARLGAGWPLALIRDTLYRAVRSGRSPWTELADLGTRIGVGELTDLGELIELVAADGARVRSTLTARAQTMRRRELADLQGRAGQADQSMRVAQVLVAIGFIVFIGYPALVAVLNF